MSKQQRDAIDAALRAEPFGLNQSTAEHRTSFDAFAVRSYPADVAAADVRFGGVRAIELTGLVRLANWPSLTQSTRTGSGPAAVIHGRRTSARPEAGRSQLTSPPFSPR